MQLKAAAARRAGKSASFWNCFADFSFLERVHQEIHPTGWLPGNARSKTEV